MQRRVPYGVANYAKLITGDYYFVDKTKYIRELERFETPVFLRSRRFGKSLWCSILEHYYDVRFADDFGKLFGKTEIGRHPTERHNTCIVVRLDFSTVEVSPNYDELMANFDRTVGGQIESAIAAHDVLRQSERVVRTGTATARLQGILNAVKDGSLPPVYVIIDEYDNFTNTLITSDRDNLYTEVTTGDSFLRTFFKTIKAGVGEGTVANVFITGVLPVTMDDLTSGYNIAKLVTFEPSLLHMLGFTQGEVDAYVDELFADHPEWSPALKATVLADLKVNYDGYQPLPGERETLYNSTVANFYLDHLNRNGVPPTDKFDPNLNTDANWIRRLARSNENAKELVDQMLLGNGLPASGAALATTFNREKLFDKTYFKVTLYYLGLATFTSPIRMGIPNLTVRKLYTDYFNTLWDLSFIVNVADDACADFVERGCDWRFLFEGFGDRYLKFLPAQAYDKMNENFIRSTFFLTFRERLDWIYAMDIEVNHASGRSDLEAVGRPNGPDPDRAVVVEFKYYTQTAMKTVFGQVLDEKGIAECPEPPADAAEQVSRYAADLAARHPGKTVEKYVACYFSSRGYRLWKVED